MEGASSILGNLALAKLSLGILEFSSRALCSRGRRSDPSCGEKQNNAIAVQNTMSSSDRYVKEHRTLADRKNGGVQDVSKKKVIEISNTIDRTHPATRRGTAGASWRYARHAVHAAGLMRSEA